MWLCDRRTVLLSTVSLAACGFEPVYGPANQTTRVPGRIDLQVPASDEGFAFRESFERRGIPGSGPIYRLTVSLSSRRRARVIQRDNSITRFNLEVTASYVLTQPDGRTLTQGEVVGTTEYSATANSFATEVAERDARDRLARNLAERLALRLSTLEPSP
ncbi:MAG: LPS assembly lipoprotein LptE [Pseudomonadota bacterium]